MRAYHRAPVTESERFQKERGLSAGAPGPIRLLALRPFQGVPSPRRVLLPLSRASPTPTPLAGDKAVKYGAITRAYGYAVMRAHDGRELKTF